MNTAPRITLDPHVCGGRPCIRGLRIRVTDLQERLAAGATQAEILEDFPYLEATRCPQSAHARSANNPASPASNRSCRAWSSPSRASAAGVRP